MRRLLAVAVALVAVFGLVVPAMAQAPAPKVTITGVIDQIGTYTSNMSKYDLNYGRSQDDEMYGRTRGRFDVVPDAQGVDAVVEGELVGYHAVPVGFSGEDAGRTQASRYSITLTARVRYTKVGAAEPLWSSDSFSFRDEYEVGSDPNIYFDREEPSMDRLTTAFARNLVAAMLEAF